MPTPAQYRTEGASKSINRTIRELTAIMKGAGITIPKGLRSKLYERIEDLAEQWYRRGFTRGVLTLRGLPVKTTRRVSFLGKRTGRVRRVVLDEPQINQF